MELRRRGQVDTWHFRPDCSRWPPDEAAAQNRVAGAARATHPFALSMLPTIIDAIMAASTQTAGIHALRGVASTLDAPVAAKKQF